MPETSKDRILSEPFHSVFCSAALASGLLTQIDVDEILVRARLAESMTEEQLAAQAVALGLLNRWQAEQLKLGRTKFSLGQYQILDSIGQGGMGHVFKAEHALLGRLEAIKVLPKSKTTPESIASFRREIRAQAQLDHPNLVRLSYAGQDGATYFFVTEFVPGADLRRLVRKNGRLTMFEAATIISQAAQGIRHAHENGLVHRDVKPGNILVNLQGITKVADLGLAGYLRDDENEEDPRAGKIVGTADYLAPETIRNPGEVSPASDIYSLGCTLYYAVTGKVPFPGGTTREKLRRQCEETPLNPLRFNAELAEAFVEVLADMMEKEPSKRIQSAEEVVQRLLPWTLQAVPISVHEGPIAPESIGSSYIGSNSDAEALSRASQSTVEARGPARDTFAQATPPPAAPPKLHETLPLDDEEVLEARLVRPWHEELADQLERHVASAWRKLRQFRLPPDIVGQIMVPLMLLIAIGLTVAVLIAVLSSR